MSVADPKSFLTGLFHKAVAAADPNRLMAAHLPEPPKGKIVVVGAGKASAAMALAFQTDWQAAGHPPVGGVVVAAYGSNLNAGSIEIMGAAHPVPDEGSENAAHRLLDAVSGLGADDLVIALISGGGSSLLSLPAGPLTAKDKRAVNSALLAGGVPIAEMNCVRKHLSAIKGGRLAAAAHPARVVSLVISDIPGDNPALVASGPTIPDEASRFEALAIIERYRLEMPRSVMDWLNDPQCAAPDPADATFANNEVHLIAASQVSLEAAAAAARAEGIGAHILSDAIEGEARVAGQFHAALARQVLERDQPFSKPCLLLSGGETTVTLKHRGRGGRNTEFLLALACGIEGLESISALAADTDGIDGSERNAGAFADGSTIGRIRRAGCDPLHLLDHNDAYTAFDAVGDLIVTGPTATNVNDFRAILIA